MTAGRYDFTIEQGTTFRRVFRWQQSDGTAVDLTGATAKMQAWDDLHLLKLVDFNEQGTVTVDGPAGTVSLLLEDDVTSQLAFDIAKYDLKIASPNTDKTCLIQGRIHVSPQETV